MNTGALALSSLLVLASALVIPAWRNKRHAGSRADAVRLLSILTLAAAVAATTWIVLQVLAVGVHHTSRARGGSMPGSVAGIPVIVIPLAILVAMVGVVEALIRADERGPIPVAPGTGAVASAAGVSIPTQPIADDVLHPHERAGLLRRRLKSDEALEYVRNEFAAGDVYSETVTADAIAQIESRWTRLLEQQAHVQASTRDAVEDLHSSVGRATTDTDAALQRVTEMCSLVTDGLDALRRERRVLVEAIALLAQPASPKPVAYRAVSPVADISIVDSEPAFVAAPIASPNVAAPIAAPVAPRIPSSDKIEPSFERSRVRTSVRRFQQRVQQASQRVWTRVGPLSDPALTTLRVRFARGEIDSAEYAARVAQLSASGPAAPPGAPGASA